VRKKFLTLISNHGKGMPPRPSIRLAPSGRATMSISMHAKLKSHVTPQLTGTNKEKLHHTSFLALSLLIFFSKALDGLTTRNSAVGMDYYDDIVLLLDLRRYRLAHCLDIFAHVLQGKLSSHGCQVHADAFVAFSLQHGHHEAKCFRTICNILSAR
jgi:hypothetical protein